MRARSLLACLLVVSTVVGTRGQQQSTQPIGQPLPSAAARQFSQQLYESYQAQVDGMLFPPTAADPSGIAAVRGPDAPRIATQLLDPQRECGESAHGRWSAAHARCLRPAAPPFRGWAGSGAFGPRSGQAGLRAPRGSRTTYYATIYPRSLA